MQTSKKLITKQSPVLPEICNGILNKSFGNKDLVEFIPQKNQIRNLPKEVRDSGIGFIFTRVSILSGFKGEIPELNKEDISDLLTTRFSTISLNELYYAFKIDRHGYHGDPTPHYQLFNAEYVVKVLNKYLKYKMDVRNRPKHL